MGAWRTAGAAFVGVSALVAAGIAGADYLENRQVERAADEQRAIERVATNFVDGSRDSAWADTAVAHYAFPLDEYYDIPGPVDEAGFRAGDTRFWEQTQSLDFTVTGAEVLEQSADGTVQVNVQFDAVKNNREGSGICRQERASKTVRLTLVSESGLWKIKSEDDNSASYNCTGDP
jgi:hypothetical protein